MIVPVKTSKMQFPYVHVWLQDIKGTCTLKICAWAKVVTTKFDNYPKTEGGLFAWLPDVRYIYG